MWSSHKSFKGQSKVINIIRSDPLMGPRWVFTYPEKKDLIITTKMLTDAEHIIIYLEHEVPNFAEKVHLVALANECHM